MGVPVAVSKLTNGMVETTTLTKRGICTIIVHGSDEFINDIYLIEITNLGDKWVRFDIRDNVGGPINASYLVPPNINIQVKNIGHQTIEPTEFDVTGTANSIKKTEGVETLYLKENPDLEITTHYTQRRREP